MAIDANLTLGALGAQGLETTEKSWPKCARCSEKLNRPYPVEVFGFVGWSKPAHLNGGYLVALNVQCHGEQAVYEMPIPAFALGVAMDQDTEWRAVSAIAAQDMGQQKFFGRSGTGLHARPEHRVLNGSK